MRCASVYSSGVSTYRFGGSGGASPTGSASSRATPPVEKRYRRRSRNCGLSTSTSSVPIGATVPARSRRSRTAA